MKEIFTEYAVAGSGPGGASTALELAKEGKHVVILEKGRCHLISPTQTNSRLTVGCACAPFFYKLIDGA